FFGRGAAGQGEEEASSCRDRLAGGGNDALGSLFGQAGGIGADADFGWWCVVVGAHDGSALRGEDAIGTEHGMSAARSDKRGRGRTTGAGRTMSVKRAIKRSLAIVVTRGLRRWLLPTAPSGRRKLRRIRRQFLPQRRRRLVVFRPDHERFLLRDEGAG